MGLFSSSPAKVKFVESAQSKRAGSELEKRGTESIKFPGRDVLDLTDIELRIEEQARAQVFGGPSELTQRGIDLTAAAAEQTDPLQDPSIKALIAEATRVGQEETGRVARGIQIAGGLGSTPGRDILGRSVGKTEKGIIAAATPLISQKLGITERARKDITGLTERLETERATFGGAVSKLRRGIKEAKSASAIEQFLNEINIRFGPQVDILKSLRDKKAVVTGGGPSLFQQAAPLIGAVTLGALTGGLSFGATGAAGAAGAASTGAGATATGAGSAATFGGMLSDRRMKENIVPIENALEKLMHLEGFTFTMKESGEEKAGIMAQDLEAVLPEAVFEIDGVKHIKLDAVLGLIVSAIKEMN